MLPFPFSPCWKIKKCIPHQRLYFFFFCFFFFFFPRKAFWLSRGSFSSFYHAQVYCLPALTHQVGWKERDEQNEYFFLYLLSAHKLWQEMKRYKFFCWTWLKVSVSWIISMQSSWKQNNKANRGIRKEEGEKKTFGELFNIRVAEHYRQ